MNEVGLKELLTQRFDAVTQRFDSVDDRLDALTAQVRETNGRLRMAEAAISDFRPRVSTLEREMGAVRQEATGENRAIKAWHVLYGLACIAGTIGVLRFFGLLR